MGSVLLTVHILVCISLVVLILLQRTDSDGMGSLGGGGSNMSSFLTGRSAANLLTRTTAILAAAFFVTSLSLTLVGRTGSNQSILDAATVTSEEQATPAVAAPAATPEAPKEMKKEEGKPSAPLAQ